MIPAVFRTVLGSQGLANILRFFYTCNGNDVTPVLSSLGALAGVELTDAHLPRNVNFRLCDYNPETASPTCDNRCDAHPDDGTSSIIFKIARQVWNSKMQISLSIWILISGNAAVILADWCVAIFSGGYIRATRPRVRRIPGQRRLSAILFVAPDLEVKLEPAEGIQPSRPFWGN